jgi:hypothetical protein
VRRSVVGIVSVASVVAMIAACSVPADGEFQKIDAADVAFGLAETTSTTTTTPTTIAPTTTVDQTTSTALPTTTTTIPEPTTTAGPQTEPVDLYFVLGDRLVKLTQPLVYPATTESVIRRLLAGPPPELRSKLPVLNETQGAGTPTDELPIRVEVERGVAQVTVPASFSEIGEGAELAFGQIVLSLSRFGIGSVVFMADGVPIQVILADGTVTAEGDPVTVEDYISLKQS